MRFENRIALVIGGNSGIGLEAAKGFAAKGAKVVITGRNAQTIDAAVADIPGSRGEVCDMADLAALDAFYAGVKAREGRIDMLAVNAGVGGFSPIPAVTPEFWDEVHSVNLRGAFFAAQKALPLMSRGGSIVFTGSIGAVMGLAGNCTYAAAKAGLRAVTRNMAKELVADGIRVNQVSPGPTETPIINRNPGMTAAEVDALRQIMTNAVPMKRLGDAAEVARAILFLASDDASFITGTDLLVDGGSVELR
jgi:NAD(P)-dependent dehydrogenase (short-subunit alcohol dehydrogenase family)